MSEQPGLDREMRRPGAEASGQTRAQAAAGDGAGGGWLSRLVSMLSTVLEELSLMKRTLRRQRHAQEAFQERMGEELAGLTGTLEALPERLQTVAGTARRETGAETGPVELSRAQIESLTRLDEAVAHMLQAQEAGEAAEDRPRTSEEALVMLQVRIRNLHRSFGLETIEGTGTGFDDRIHCVHSVCHRAEAGNGEVVEVLRPGYRRGEQVLRPALVIVNRQPGPGPGEGVERS